MTELLQFILNGSITLRNIHISNILFEWKSRRKWDWQAIKFEHRVDAKSTLISILKTVSTKLLASVALVNTFLFVIWDFYVDKIK